MPPRAPVLLLVLLLLSAPAAAQGFAIDLYPRSTAASVFVLWVLVLFLVLVHCDEIRRATLAHVWGLSTWGQVLFLVGLTIVQASYLSVPADAYNPWVAANPYPSAARLVVTFAVVVSGLLFLVEWSRIFDLHPRMLSPANLPYLALSVVLASGSFALPFAIRPDLGISPRTLAFPGVAATAFLALTAYLTLTGYLLLHRVRVLGRFRWMLGHSALLLLLTAVLVWEYAATPEGLRAEVYSPILFPLFVGVLVLLVGYVFLIRSTQLFVRAFLPAPARRPSPGAEGELALEIVADLARRYISEAPLERIIAAATRERPVLASIVYDRRERRLSAPGLDTASPEVSEALSALYLGLFEGLVRSRPPAVDDDYTEGSLKRQLLERFGDRTHRLPASIAGHLLPGVRVLRSALKAVMDALLSALPLDAVFGAHADARLREALGGDFITREGERAVFDADGFFASLEARGLEEDELVDEAVGRHLRAHRAMFEAAARVLDHRRLCSLLEEHVRPAFERPAYRSEEACEALLNAYFARDHGWGIEEMDAAAGRIQAGYLVLLAADPGFPKERFCSALLAENLEHYRNGVWVSQAKPAVLKEFLSAYIGADQLLGEGSLKLVRIDPSLQGVQEQETGILRVGDRPEDLEWCLRRAVGGFPPSAVCVAVELPVPLLQGEPLELYRFASFLKGLGECHNVVLLLVVNNELCGDKAFAVLGDLCEVVVEAKKDGRARVRRIGTTKEAFARLPL